MGVPASAAGTPISSSGGLTKFTDCPSFTRYMRQVAAAESPPVYGGPVYRGGPVMPNDSAGPKPGAPGAAIPAAGNSATGTNVQETGVDEPDVAKVDGRTLFSLVGSRMNVVDVGTSKPRLRGFLDFPAGQAPQELLVLPGQRVLAIGNSYAAWGPGPRPLANSGRPATVMPIRPGTAYVDLTVVDVSDPVRPRISWIERVTGSYISGRLHDGVARIVFGSAPRIEYPPYQQGDSPQAAADRNRAAVASAPAEDFLPARQILDGSGRTVGQGPLLHCTDVSRPPWPSGAGIITVLTIDTKLGTQRFTDARGSGVVGTGELVYASANRLYVATTEGGWNSVRPVPAVGSQPAQPAERRTAIHAFDATGRTATPYLGSGTVPGYVLGRWAFSEYHGNLRVATTTGEPWAPPDQARSQSGIVVLAEGRGALHEIGSVGGLGRGERIRAVRWFDDLAAVVTFRQTDPLYLVDLSAPAAPRVRGELQLPGYSAYLHPTGGGGLLGIGQDADAQGHVLGLLAQQFNVSDAAHPTRTGKLPLGRGWTNVENDSRAFTYLTQRHLAILPAWITEKVYCPPNAECSAGGGNGDGYAGEITVPAALGIGIDSRGRLHLAGKFVGDSMILRVVPVGDRLAAVTQNSVVLLDAVGLREIGSVRTAPQPPQGTAPGAPGKPR